MNDHQPGEPNSCVLKPMASDIIFSSKRDIKANFIDAPSPLSMDLIDFFLIIVLKASIYIIYFITKYLERNSYK